MEENLQHEFKCRIDEINIVRHALFTYIKVIHVTFRHFLLKIEKFCICKVKILCCEVSECNLRAKSQSLKLEDPKNSNLI